MPSLRLVSVDLAAFGRDRAAVGAAVAAAAPQLAVLHSSPHLLQWRSRCAAIAREAGLVVVGGGRVGGANLILSTLGVDVVAVSDVLFTNDPLRPAGASVAQVQVQGVPFTVAGVSFGAVGPAAALPRLELALAAAGGPFVLSVSSDIAALRQHGAVTADRLVVGPQITAGSVDRGAHGLVAVELTLPGAG